MKFTPQRQGVKTDKFKKQKQTRRVSEKMGRQREQSPIERKKESSERVLNEIEASKLSDNEFKTMVIRKLNELSENYQKLQGKKVTKNLLRITPAWKRT